MTSPIDIYRSASILLGEYGEDAKQLKRQINTQWIYPTIRGP